MPKKSSTTKKYNMPGHQEFFGKKYTFGPKPEPVWVYLEREMREKAFVKPYNEKVGEWLKYLKDLKTYQHFEAKRKERRIQKEIGPSWYAELSNEQKNALKHLKQDIQSDLIEDLPRRVRSCLSDLGCTLKLSNPVLMKAMQDAYGDPVVFVWNLYSEYYKVPPNELRSSYDQDAKILMSSLVFMDMEECLEMLSDLAKHKKPDVPEIKKKPKMFRPISKPTFNEYLQTTKTKLYSNNLSEEQVRLKETQKAPPLEYKVKLRSDESYAKLCNDTNFLERRKSRNMKERGLDSNCQYKFWEAPSTLRNTDPKMVAYVYKLKMIKLRPKAKFKAPFENVQYNVGNVAFAGGRPRYLLNGISNLPSGYIPINGGLVHINGEMVMQVAGYWKFPRDIRNCCDAECDCSEKWNEAVTKYLQKSRCTCGHRYDLYHVGKAKEKYFHPSTRYGKFWFDQAKIYQMDPREDFIKDTVRDSLLSRDVTPEPSEPSIAPARLKEKALLGAFLSELSDTPLVIPHLPQANLLNNLQEWVRKRVKGPISQADKKKMLIKSQRRWLDLKHKSFIALPSRIPFTMQNLQNMNWDHRHMFRHLAKMMRDDFADRNRNNILQQTQLWWSTMKHDANACKGFTDIFFTYMPARKKDIYVNNPYSPHTVKRYGAKPCPLTR